MREIIAIILCEQGTSSKCESSAHADYVPVLCTHRPSLPGTELIREDRGLLLRRVLRGPFVAKSGLIALA
uniref:Uncharacterized protein n=1 Tax=Panagrellus redivivus TaxID=6233 RepID=A0A7E4VUN2_PANRE